VLAEVGARLLVAATGEGDWSPARGAPIHRVAGRTLGIIGFGKMGRTLGGKASGLGLEIDAARNVADVPSGRRPVSVVYPEVLGLERRSHLSLIRRCATEPVSG